MKRPGLAHLGLSMLLVLVGCGDDLTPAGAEQIIVSHLRELLPTAFDPATDHIRVLDVIEVGEANREVRFAVIEDLDAQMPSTVGGYTIQVAKSSTGWSVYRYSSDLRESVAALQTGEVLIAYEPYLDAAQLIREWAREARTAGDPQAYGPPPRVVDSILAERSESLPDSLVYEVEGEGNQILATAIRVSSRSEPEVYCTVRIGVLAGMADVYPLYQERSEYCEGFIRPWVGWLDTRDRLLEAIPLDGLARPIRMVRPDG